MKNLILVLIVFVFLSCKNSAKNELSAQEIVDKSIAVSGGENYLTKSTSFVFREKTYRSDFESGKKVLERQQLVDSVVVKDILKSNGLRRYHNDSLVVLADTTALKYANSVNSVHYFARLPFGLNDQAVKKELLGIVELNETEYYKVKVTFEKENGGKDFEDTYLYWFNSQTFKPEFLAYEFYTDGGGKRLREAFNERYVNGIRFVDYRNFRPIKNTVSLLKIDSLFSNGGMELLSTIELEELQVANPPN